MYISGFACRKLLNVQPKCTECITKFISDSAPTTIFSKFKNYRPDGLINTTLSLRKFIHIFEGFFKGNISDAFVAKNPRQYILTLFQNSRFYDLSDFSCSLHGVSLATKFIVYYSNVRLYYEVKLFNQKLSLSSKGNELNKDRKLNM